MKASTRNESSRKSIVSSGDDNDNTPPSAEKFSRRKPFRIRYLESFQSFHMQEYEVGEYLDGDEFCVDGWRGVGFVNVGDFLSLSDV